MFKYYKNYLFHTDKKNEKKKRNLTITIAENSLKSTVLQKLHQVISFGLLLTI